MASDRETCQRICSVLGAHFVMAPLSFMWFYGNLVAYMDSYFHFACSRRCLDADSQWILAMFVAGHFPGVFLVKPLVQRMGLKWTGVVTMVISNAAMLSTAWSLQISVAWTAVIYGVFIGTCMGICTSVSLQVVSGWTPKWTGVFMATATGFPTMLSVVQNQMITAYINPHNLKTDSTVGVTAYFSQPEILERVPSAVIIIAAMNFGLQFVGYTLVTNPPKPSHVSLKIVDGAEQGGRMSLQPFHSTDTIGLERDVDSYGSNNCNPDVESIGTTGASQIKQTSLESGNHPQAVKTAAISWKPSEVLLSSAYYAVLLTGMAIDFGLQLKANFYKQFAQLYIHNDRYLTLVGTLVPVTSTVSRIVFGALLDKGYLSLKDVSVFGLSVNSVLCAFWYFAPQISAIFYLFLVLGLAVAQSLFYVVIFCAALRLFGPDHLSTNYALTLVCILLASVLTPIMATVFLQSLGWFWLLASCSIFNLVTLVFVIAANYDTQEQ